MSRIFGFLGVVITLAIGMYIYSQQAKSSSSLAGATNPKAAIDVTGVKADLIAIGSAERRHFASEGKYVSLDELISSGDISVARHRGPYSYDIQTSGSAFKVVANRSGDDSTGTPSQLSVDENMEFQTTP